MTRQLLAAIGVLAVAVAGSPASAKERKPVDPTKKICRRYDTTGSIIGYRYECHTPADWVKVDQGNTNIAREASDPRSRFGGYGLSQHAQ